MDDPLLVQFLSNIIRLVIVTIALLIGLKMVGLGGIATSILASAGVGAFVIGFALKDIGENFLAGIMMAFKRPFRLGDTVELSGIKGKVIALSLRDTQIKTFDGKDVFIPNGAVVKNPVVNYTVDGFIRSDLLIRVENKEDVSVVVQLIETCLNGISELEKGDRSPSVVVDEITDGSINIRIFYWINTFKPKMPGGKLKNKIFHEIISSLLKNGISLSKKSIELTSLSE